MSSTSKPLQNYRKCQKNDENNIQMTTVETLYKLQSCQVVPCKLSKSQQVYVSFSFIQSKEANKQMKKSTTKPKTNEEKYTPKFQN